MYVDNSVLYFENEGCHSTGVCIKILSPTPSPSHTTKLPPRSPILGQMVKFSDALKTPHINMPETLGGGEGGHGHRLFEDQLVS